jgi:phosphoglycerol transferase MdoB-like AlkP superfamily enzyme
MSAQMAYQGLVLLLLIVGFLLGASFIVQHRPRQWRRLAAWDASGFVLIATAIYARNIVLVVSRWPWAPTGGVGDAVFAVVSLIVIDALFVLRVVSYRSFAQRDQERIDEGRKDAIT